MSLDRNCCRIVAFLIVLLFAGCNATLNKERVTQINESLSQITAIDPTTHIELLFYEKFNQIIPSASKTSSYKLAYSLIVSNTQTLTIRQNSSNLKHTTVTVEFNLINEQTGEVVHNGKISSEATSGAVSSLYQQEQSSKFAQERLAILLAQRVYQNLYLYFLDNLAIETY